MTTIFCNPSTLSAIRANIENSRTRSAWSRGVNLYALDILDSMAERADWYYSIYEEYPKMSESFALNGASDWRHYAEGGNGLIYTYKIVGRLCTPGEIRKYNDGKFRNINFIEVEARALYQAFRVIVLSCSLLS